MKGVRFWRVGGALRQVGGAFWVRESIARGARSYRGCDGARRCVINAACRRARPSTPRHANASNGPCRSAPCARSPRLRQTPENYLTGCVCNTGASPMTSVPCGGTKLNTSAATGPFFCQPANWICVVFPS